MRFEGSFCNLHARGKKITIAIEFTRFTQQHASTWLTNTTFYAFVITRKTFSIKKGKNKRKKEQINSKLVV